MRNPERPLYLWAAAGALLIVFAGFARTYYLKLAFGTPPLSLLLHVHGLVMSAWFVLVAAQVWLVSRGRVGLHRRLGILGAVLALAVLVVGTATAITAARLGRAPPGPPPLQFLAVPLGDMLMFAGLVGAGLALRHRRDSHKRLMLLACVGLLTAAIARVPVSVWPQLGILAYVGVTLLLVLICLIWDTWRNRRLHPAFAWGAGWILLTWALRLGISGTDAWLRFARALVS